MSAVFVWMVIGNYETKYGVWVCNVHTEFHENRSMLSNLNWTHTHTHTHTAWWSHTYVYCETPVKHINTIYGQNAEFLNVKIGHKYSYHSALMAQILGHLGNCADWSIEWGREIMNCEFGRSENKSVVAYFIVQSQHSIWETEENYVKLVSIFTPGS
jgi:hypothetical protein